MDNQVNINYVEFSVTDIEATKSFFSEAFGWTFIDYGPDYASFSNRGLDGGFSQSTGLPASDGGALIVLYSADLKATLKRVEQAGGIICKPIFAFPGGRRFHFVEPGGNQLAVWSDKVED
ncbi:VOC family protein [Thalassotalea ponticola]|uniref:VOC family protein n=1 Tax=Thalassotalea ponticola TaxID=1523392 RepID=UPI0025B2FD26|nr:VOC family protein [Thalassotalea ponticola]MDN3651268.1 VOC family protein [Thalassotalea ponticola]